MTFKPGQSGNPKGRPKRGMALTDELQALLQKKDDDGRPRKDLLAERLWRLSNDPDPNVALRALIYIYDRIDGKPKQALEHTGDADAPLRFTIRIANDDTDSN